MDARALLAAGPDGFVQARDQAVKELRAAGDKEAAAAVKALSRPSLTMWAVLQAAANERAVRALMTSTNAVQAAQLASVRDQSARNELNRAVDDRRRALDALTDDAVDALSRTGKGGSAKRDEIKSALDRLSRHPDLVDSWLDATLRDVPTDTGFDAFASADIGERPVRRAASHQDAAVTDRNEVGEAEERVRAAERNVEAARRKAERARADRERADERAAAAQRADESAQQSLRDAERELVEAQERVNAASKARATHKHAKR